MTTASLEQAIEYLKAENQRLRELNAELTHDNTTLMRERRNNMKDKSCAPQDANINVFCFRNEQDNLELPPEFVLHLLGGEWPRSQEYGYSPGFAWDQVDSFVIENGELVPYLAGSPMDGPNLRIDAVPNPLTRVSADRTEL